MFFRISGRGEEIKITLNAVNTTKLPNITNILGNIIVTDLTIEDTPIPVLTTETFQNFKYIHTLVLDNTDTEFVENNTFKDLKNLKNLYIVNNKLDNFRLDILNQSSLNWLDLSNNSIYDLSDFHINAISSLTVFNISSNALEFLPKDILDKLKQVNKFYLIVDNNPLDCSHPKWNGNLSEELSRVFCSNTSFIENEFKSAEDQPVSINSTKQFLANCSTDNMFRTRFAFWIFGSIWLGIILGNISKLKQLLFCPQITTVEDKAIQCGKYIIFEITFQLLLFFISNCCGVNFF